MDKQLKDKAIQFKGKDYVQVKDRVNYFNEEYPNGSIETEILNQENERVVMKATIIPDVSNARRFTGHSQAVWGDGYINKTSALENAETSAVGRAMAMMGIGVIDGISSVDEINKAQLAEPANMYQVTEIKKLAEQYTTPEKLTEALKRAGVSKVEDLSKTRAEFILTKLREKRDENN